MKNKKEKEKVQEFLNNIEFLSEEDVKKMNFYEACLYLEKLNLLDEISKEVNSNE